MKFEASGRNMELGESLKERSKERLEERLGKYGGGILECGASFVKDARVYRVNCHVRLRDGELMQASGEGDDAYAGFEGALERLEKQVRRRKRRREDKRGLLG